MLRFIVLILILSVSHAIPLPAKAKSLPQIYQAEVIEIVDGDTIRVSIPLWIDHTLIKTIRIRGIDTPELRSKCHAEKQAAELAKTKLSDLIGGRTVSLKNVAYGKYAGRVLADIYLDDVNVSDWLIDQDLAIGYGGGKRSSWC